MQKQDLGNDLARARSSENRIAVGGRQLVESERFHAARELRAPNRDIEQTSSWSEFLDSNVHTCPYIYNDSMLKYVVMTRPRWYKYNAVTMVIGPGNI